ncbi:helix-turn-helix transcriptional regulator [Hamadaea sp. NPDC051192]|uniref:helix-turn-helix transcriptional regulator n=1 Tax=Hamadaea sp. NPDC051192 TaxID=3154940 RepID=UPI00344AA736
MNRADLAEYLRDRRARLRPIDVGLPDNGRRRTPGLRRQEVAQLAGMSVEYYTRLEQARGPRPSRQILNALGRALMLSIDERAYLFHLAGETVSPASRPAGDVPRGILNMISAMSDQPAYVIDVKYDILAWNELATEFIGDLSAPGVERNMLRWIFRSPHLAEYLCDLDHSVFVRSAVADLRAASARYPDDDSLNSLVAELLRLSPEFGELWADHEVEVRRGMNKTFVHPVVGTVDFHCEVLLIPDRDQRLIVYTTEPGSPSWRAMRELRQGQAKIVN